MEDKFLYKLIVSQLSHDGYQHIAGILKDTLGITPNVLPSSHLRKLVKICVKWGKDCEISITDETVQPIPLIKKEVVDVDSTCDGCCGRTSGQDQHTLTDVQQPLQDIIASQRSYIAQQAPQLATFQSGDVRTSHVPPSYPWQDGAPQPRKRGRPARSADNLPPPAVLQQLQFQELQNQEIFHDIDLGPLQAAAAIESKRTALSQQIIMTTQPQDNYVQVGTLSQGTMSSHQGTTQDITTHAASHTSLAQDVVHIKQEVVEEEERTPDFRCYECAKSFQEECYLKVHYTKVHRRGGGHNCPDCHKSFAEKRFLVQHMKYHANQRPFNCTLCMKGFMKPSDLKRHLMIHTGERPYTCDICAKGFIQFTGLAEHRRKKHTEDEGSSAQSTKYLEDIRQFRKFRSGTAGSGSMLSNTPLADSLLSASTGVWSQICQPPKSTAATTASGSEYTPNVTLTASSGLTVDQLSNFTPPTDPPPITDLDLSNVILVQPITDEHPPTMLNTIKRRVSDSVDLDISDETSELDAVQGSVQISSAWLDS